MTILLTNDDGIWAKGLVALRDRLREHADVFVCAPAQDCSATGHSLSLSRPLRLKEVAPKTFSVDGTPVDCVIVALHCLLSHRPDVVLSGINHGPNLGQDVFYSGTVAAALEAGMHGIPSAAISMVARGDGALAPASDVGLWLARFLAETGLPQGVVLNVNVPASPCGMRLTRLGRRRYRDSVSRRHEGDEAICWIGGGVAEWEHDPASDYAAVSEGFVSLTPLGQDLTRSDVVDTLRIPERPHEP